MTDIVAGAMSDKPPLSDIGLRDRIAAVLFERLGRDLGYAADAQWDSVDQAAFLADADAVIAELGLHIDSPADGWLRAKTKMWKADDE